jgi:hypothetical protein
MSSSAQNINVVVVDGGRCGGDGEVRLFAQCSGFGAKITHKIMYKMNLQFYDPVGH